MYSGLSLGDVMATEITPEVAATAARDYWPIERELLATIVEMLDTLIMITAKAYGSKAKHTPVKVPRPGHSNVQKEEPMSAGAFSRQLIHGGGF